VCSSDLGPWLHDGSITSLQQTVDRMARHQSGRYLENQDIDDIVAFLRALGDSLGMLGDCSVSGNYSVTMDCSMNQTAPGASQAGDSTALAPLPDSVELARRHQEQYDAPSKHVAATPTRIEEEMQRIRSGQVAHYDFLQYEHIEMLRHARALSFPPASLAAEQHEAMLSQAEQLQQSAEQYELIIADFLRAQAVASSAKFNYQDLLRVLSVDADEKTLSLLAQAEQSALAFYAKPQADTQRELESSTQALTAPGTVTASQPSVGMD